MKRWEVLNSTKAAATQDIIKILLENRGIKNLQQTQDFISPKLENVTLKSANINEKEVEQTVLRIKKAVEGNEGIVVYGDYDVDGICGAAILWECIHSFYKNVYPYIPHRVDEGYGLSEKGILNIQEQLSNVTLIITVDNGIVANKAVEFAKLQKIDVIVTDHHVAGDKLPNAQAIVHTTELCGTGVAYLLAQEISKEFSITPHDNFLELVALATVADLVPLNKNNRTLLKYGLLKLRNTKRAGLLALFKEAKIQREEIDTYHIGHMIAPRLNATGRISHAMDGLRLICTLNSERAAKLARSLEEINKERQTLTFDSAEDAKTKVEDLGLKEDSLLFVSDAKYDQGVVGLIASRLVEEFYKPSIAVSIGEKFSKGSARSVSGVNIVELIRSVPTYLKEAGGHPMAAGFSVETKDLESFKNELVKKANEVIDKALFKKTLKIDTELDINLIDLLLHNEIQKLSPFGMGNPSPVFMTKGVTVVSMNRVGKNKEHVQVVLEKDATFFKGIIFKNKEDLGTGKLIDVVYSIEKNEWGDKVSVELRVKDTRPI